MTTNKTHYFIQKPKECGLPDNVECWDGSHKECKGKFCPMHKDNSFGIYLDIKKYGYTPLIIRDKATDATGHVQDGTTCEDGNLKYRQINMTTTQEIEMTRRKEAFARFVEKNPDACSADYETWHQVWDELYAYFADSQNKIDALIRQLKQRDEVIKYLNDNK